jgi:hypothetical protein
MANVKKTKVYETTDGEIFKDKDKSEAHQKKLDFIYWYENNDPTDGIEGERGGTPAAADVYEWLIKNSNVISGYLLPSNK